MKRFILLIGGCLLLTATAQAQQAEPAPLLTLEEAVELVVQQNPTVQMARNDARIARNNFSRGNAGFWPTLSFDAGRNGSRSNTRQVFISQEDPVSRERALSSRYNAGVQLNWTLFDGLSRFAVYDRLEAEAALAQEQATATTEDLVAATVETYYGLISLQEQVEVQEEAVALSEERLRIAEVRRDLGSASELEVRQAQVDLNTDRSTLLEQQVQLANAKVAFNRQLGRPGNPAFAVADTILVNPALELEALAASARAQNRDVQLAEANRSVAAYRRSEVKAEWLPTISLSTGYGYSYLDSESGFLSSSRAYELTYGITASYDLFDGFNRDRRAQNAQIALTNAELQLDDTQLQLDTDLRTVYNTYVVNLQQIELEQANLAAARLNVEVALERFELGTISSIELREVQETLVRAQSRLIATQFSAKSAEVELLRLAGQLDVRD